MRRIPDTLRKKIWEMWLEGKSYRAIRTACHVSLATVHTVKEEAKTGTPDAEDLRVLSLLLRKSSINFYDTQRGAELLDRLNEYGASLDELEHFIKLAEMQLSKPQGQTEAIIGASLRLMDLEDKTGKPYLEIVKDFQRLRSRQSRLQNQITHLRKEIQVKETELSVLERRGKQQAAENSRLNDERNRLLDSTASLGSIAQVLKDGALPIPCRNCQQPLRLKLPSKRNYGSLVQENSGYNIQCRYCGAPIWIPVQEVPLRIGWTLLPLEDPFGTVNH